MIFYIAYMYGANFIAKFRWKFRLPYSFCGRNILSFEENLLVIFGSCEPLIYELQNVPNWTQF